MNTAAQNPAAAKIPRRSSSRSEAFKFNMCAALSPRSTAGRIVHRLAQGKIAAHQANSLLMAEFTRRRNAGAFSALYEINYKLFLYIIKKKAAGLMHIISPADILQDVFFMIYRYPDKFRFENDYSFRNWSYTIIVNTIRKRVNKHRFKTVALESIPETPDGRAFDGPLNRLIASEEARRIERLYSILLMLYLNAFRSRLNTREQEALYMVEVEQVAYRDAARRLGIKYENFKMLVCRSRKKIAEGVADMVDHAADLSFRMQAAVPDQSASCSASAS